MTDKIINDDWLFKTNSKEQIGLWVANLKYAFFWRRPSFRDDADYITLTLNFNDFDDLVNVLEKLNIELKKIPEDFPRPEPNKPYSWDEYKKFKNPIKDFPEYEQPSLKYINEIPTRIWVENKKISFKFSGANGNSYEVCDKDYLNCLEFESIIEKSGLEQKVNREYEANVGTITLDKYPSLKNTL